ncbi:hypothetical protein [Actinokineospora inagensis]|uniref:hypothetical protein n=1 Tax=Actinokineospora inagensis TaxID=103730 RepID=UPI00041251EE|nr:hypothetical protein [Actinokineospora inagensis]
MTHTTISHNFVELAATLGLHLVTYALPNPFQADLSVRGNRKSDHEITVFIQTDSLAETASQVLHWHNTLQNPDVTLTGETDLDSPKIGINGKIANNATIFVTAILPPDTVDEYRAQTIAGAAVITWLHIAAQGGK